MLNTYPCRDHSNCCCMLYLTSMILYQNREELKFLDSLPVFSLLIIVLMTRYYTEDFDYGTTVVCTRQLLPLTKVAKRWTGSQIAIEGLFTGSRWTNSGTELLMYYRDRSVSIRSESSCRNRTEKYVPSCCSSEQCPISSACFHYLDNIVHCLELARLRFGIPIQDTTFAVDLQVSIWLSKYTCFYVEKISDKLLELLLQSELSHPSAACQESG